ncbi:MAG: hypothetical protein F6K24_30050 [Okeania sp. SIO2D1]|nr:hypothetical protein [Okeania sp. SIO2D1]
MPFDFTGTLNKVVGWVEARNPTINEVRSQPTPNPSQEGNRRGVNPPQPLRGGE